MSSAMQGDNDEQGTGTPEPGAVGSERFVNAAVTIPADGLADFYQAVADWHHGYEAKRGRAMRGQDAPAGQ